MILTGALGSPPMGYGLGNKVGGPQNLLCGGLGTVVPQTARAWFRNTPAMHVHITDTVSTPGDVPLDGAGNPSLPEGPAGVFSSNPVDNGAFATDAGYLAFPTRRGDNGDAEYPVMTPAPANRFNATSLTLFLPEGFIPNTVAGGRILAYMRAIKELTAYTTCRQTQGAELFVLEDEALDYEDWRPT